MSVEPVEYTAYDFERDIKISKKLPAVVDATHLVIASNNLRVH